MQEFERSNERQKGSGRISNHMSTAPGPRLLSTVLTTRKRVTRKQQKEKAWIYYYLKTVQGFQRN